MSSSSKNVFVFIFYLCFFGVSTAITYSGVVKLLKDEILVLERG